MHKNNRVELFKTIANRLVGHWHNFEKEGGYIFSLCPAQGVPAKVNLFSNSQSYNSVYTLFISGENDPVIILGDPSSEPELSIKVLLKDTLILQSGKNKLQILERKADIEFANGILAGLNMV